MEFFTKQFDKLDKSLEDLEEKTIKQFDKLDKSLNDLEKKSLELKKSLEDLRKDNINNSNDLKKYVDSSQNYKLTSFEILMNTILILILIFLINLI